MGMRQDSSARDRDESEQRFLADAGALLGASLDYRKALEDLAHLAVPFLGDWCAVGVVEQSGTIRRIALAHSDPEKTSQAGELDVDRVVPQDSPYGMAVTIRTGSPVIHGDVEEMLGSMPADGRQPRLLRILGARSMLSVPLQARGRILGAISLFSVESGRRYSEADLPLVEEFARRASLAADNARLYGEVQIATAAKDEFLSLVSHELRTPLTGIYGAVRILRTRGEQLSVGDRAELLDVLEQESDRMRRLVEDLLVLSRLELGQEPVLEPVMAQRLIEKVIAGLPPMRSNRQVELHIQSNLPPLAAEPTFFEQVLRNLLNNADKYSPIDASVEVSAVSTSEGEVAVSVLDQGVGLSAEEIERIFEPFYRAPGTAKTKGGMGIGLTVCKRLTEAQNGHIWARAREGGGAEIGFTLKRYKDVDEE